MTEQNCLHFTETYGCEKSGKQGLCNLVLAEGRHKEGMFIADRVICNFTGQELEIGKNFRASLIFPPENLTLIQ